jgi:hypothetical protein
MKKYLAAFGMLLSLSAFAQTASNGMHQHHDQAPDTSMLDPKIVKAFSSDDPAVHEARKAVVKKLYEGLIHPNPIAVLNGTESVEDIFEKQVIQGRVVPAGSYNNFASATEYFYALAETPVQYVDKVTFKTLLAAEDKVAVRVDIHFCRLPFTDCDLNATNNDKVVTLTEEGFFTFNEFNRIISFDVIIPNLGAAFDVKDKKARDGQILQLCVGLTAIHQDTLSGKPVAGGTCTSTFDSPEDFPAADRSKYGKNAFINCVTFMHSLEYGSFNRANSNTFVCRQLHTLLTQYRPDEHCPHVSSTGGEKCVDWSYDSFYQKDF